MRRSVLRDTLMITGIVAVTVAAALGVIAAGGRPVAPALSALVAGSFGSPFALFSATLVRATPLILLGLAVGLAFRAGILNIGAEGQFLMGASAAIAAGLAIGPVLPRVVAFVLIGAAGVGAGVAWAGIAAILKRWYGVLEVISTLMLNFVALYVVGYLVRGPLQEPTRAYPYTSALDDALHLPRLLRGQQLHVGFALAILLAVVLWWTLRATAAGFRVRAVGAGPAAARSAGRVDVDRVVFRVFLVSGAIAGLAGAVEGTGVTFRLFEGISPGYGYSAIAVALLARLNPLAIVGTGVFFGALEAGSAAMQRDAGVPAQFATIIEALVVLGVLALDRLGSRDQGDA
ncbi:MAG: ABC transporter permease [Gemmatimonadetes bacterium]|nr:ABC transporter permease [Gemmatimonadota bacterium]